MTQPGLFDVVVVAQANPVKREIDRLNAAAERVLERLKTGPATNWQLCEVGGIRAVGRAWELRRHGWIIEKRHVSKGTWLYSLKGRA